ncbi:MAG: hypothetical protein KAJ19_10035 [Gammaproteobacteria bacterium]|nr:hypothetical protein [Gammaproteobacteria bacterium]
MTNPIFVVDLKKAQPTETADGLLTHLGMTVIHKYAVRWLSQGERDLDVERKYPELAGLFYDVRIDLALAREHAVPLEA